MSHLFGSLRQGSSESAEYTSGELIAGETAEQSPICRVDSDIATSGDNFPCVAVDVPLLGEHRQRLVTAVKSRAYNLRTLGNKYPLLWLKPVAKLGLGEASVDFETVVGEIIDFDDGYYFAASAS